MMLFQPLMLQELKSAEMALMKIALALIWPVALQVAWI